MFTSFIKLHPYVKKILSELKEYKTTFPPGHFYNPIVNAEEVKNNEHWIYDMDVDAQPGIELNEKEQLQLLEQFLPFYHELPFPLEQEKEFRYYYNNTFYSYSDAIFLYSMMRWLKPKNIVEIGSGFSSALMMDTNDRFLNKSVNLNFIDPYQDNLKPLLRSDDNIQEIIHEKKVQEINPEFFDMLNENDILFIDSSHVSKSGSDVNYLFFRILPRLKKGIYIHFHDITYPFEYPRELVLNTNNSEYFRGFGWNESYLLRAFLMYNPAFRIVAFNTFLSGFHRDWFEKNMPMCLKHTGGSIWLKKI